MTSSKTSSVRSRSLSAKTGRYVQKVTPSMVASARAQITIAKKLGKTVPPAISKIAEVGAE